MLARELGRVQARCTQWRDDCVARAHCLEAQLMRARAQVIVRETLLAIARDELMPCASGRPRAVRGWPRAAGSDLSRTRRRGGGLFAHVDGATNDCWPNCSRPWPAPDLVILQAGYVRRDVCRAIESHCTRTGVRRIHLDKACALGFARALQEGSGSEGA